MQISSIGGVTAFPNVGMYHASKWALEGFSQALEGEVAEFGIHVTLVEPAGFATDWAGPSAKRARESSAYDAARARMVERRANTVPGDPAASGAAMLALVDAAEPPLRVFFWDVGLPMIRQEYAKRLAMWEKWDFIAEMAQGERKNRDELPAEGRGEIRGGVGVLKEHRQLFDYMYIYHRHHFRVWEQAPPQLRDSYLL